MPTPHRRPTRRTVLAGLGASVVAGIAGCSESREPVVIETTVHLSDGDSRETMVDGERDDLEAGQYVWWEFSLDTRLEVDYRVRVTEGETVNVYLLTAEQREIFDEEESGFEAVEGSIATETSRADRSVSLDAGDYTFVVANADILPENA